MSSSSVRSRSDEDAIGIPLRASTIRSTTGEFYTAILKHLDGEFGRWGFAAVLLGAVTGLIWGTNVGIGVALGGLAGAGYARYRIMSYLKDEFERQSPGPHSPGVH